ncbi:MAG TPA: hypothetical protein VGL39_05030 [Jatrophihabitantaceae bacterium]|jgi:hypothetical protein
MTGAAKRKGDRAELEIARLISDELGIAVRRKLGAGRTDDTGDLDGIPNTTAQVANWADALRAIREKPLAAEVQRGNAGDLFAVSFIRTRGGIWRAVMTVEQWATYAREVLR